jgi:hypothetical protein
MYGVAPKPALRLASIHFAKFDGVPNGELLLLRCPWKRQPCGNPHSRRSILRPGTGPVWSVHGEYMFRAVLARVNGARQGAIEPVRKAEWTASGRDRVLPCATPNGCCAVGSATTRRTSDRRRPARWPKKRKARRRLRQHTEAEVVSSSTGTYHARPGRGWVARSAKRAGQVSG